MKLIEDVPRGETGYREPQTAEPLLLASEKGYPNIAGKLFGCNNCEDGSSHVPAYCGSTCAVLAVRCDGPGQP